MLKRTLTLAAGLALSFSAVVAQAADVLKVTAIPDEAPTELLRKFKPLGAYLEQELGMKVEFVPVADYAAVVEALAADRIDMAWLGGFTFVQARLKTGNAVPLAQREQDAEFTSKFITSDPAVKSLQDLKGKTFAFGSVSSKEIATACKEQHGIEIDKKKIQLPESLKNFGSYEVTVKLHPQVAAKLTVKVTEA